MSNLLDNIFWHSLSGPHAKFAAGAGGARRFAREYCGDQTGRVVQPALDSAAGTVSAGLDSTVHPYFRGSWGPADAERILAVGDKWYLPAT